MEQLTKTYHLPELVLMEHEEGTSPIHTTLLFLLLHYQGRSFSEFIIALNDDGPQQLCDYTVSIPPSGTHLYEMKYPNALIYCTIITPPEPPTATAAQLEHMERTLTAALPKPQRVELISPGGFQL